MSCNNQGIFHLNLNGAVACKNRMAHMFIKIDEFRTIQGKRCKRCEKVLAKLDASAAKKAARLAAEAADASPGLDAAGYTAAMNAADEADALAEEG